MRLNYRRTALVGLTFLSISAFWQLYNFVIPLILQYTFGFKEDVIGYVMAEDNILALFLLPLFGTLSDRTHTRLGKRTPFILVGTVVSVALMVILPLADWYKNLTLFVITLALLLIAMATYRSPAVALMPDVTPKPLRSKANAIINLLGAVGGIFAYLVIAVLAPPVNTETGTKDSSYLTLFLCIAALMSLTLVILLLTIRENRLAAMMPADDAKAEDTPQGTSEKMPRDVKRSLIFMLFSVAFWYMAYNAVETAYSRFVLEEWNQPESVASVMMIVAMLVATASYVPIGILSGKIGRKKVILGGVVLMGLSFATGMLFTAYSVLMYAVMGCIGIGWAAINVNSYPMVVEMSKSGDIGKYTGYYYTFSMAAQVFTPILSGYLFRFFGYKALFPYAVAFSAIAFVTMCMVRHGDVKVEKAGSLLENFDVD